MRLQMFDGRTGAPAGEIEIPDLVMAAARRVENWMRESGASELSGLMLDRGMADRFNGPKRERIIDGMGAIVRRMTRVAPRGDLVLADHDERELSIALLAYLEGRQPESE